MPNCPRTDCRTGDSPPPRHAAGRLGVQQPLGVSRGRRASSTTSISTSCRICLTISSRIPGTPIRFGLDGIVGFIPGIGDVIGGIASTIIIVAAWFRGVSGGHDRAHGSERGDRNGGRARSRCSAISSTLHGAPTAATTSCSKARSPTHAATQRPAG